MHKAAIWIAAAVLLVLGVWACNSDRKLTWEEQTTAPGYGAIVVRRTLLYEPYHVLGGPAGRLDHGEIAQLIDPSTLSRIGPPLKFMGRLMLIENDKATNRLSLTAVLTSCAATKEYGKPVPRYAKWVLNSTPNEWVRIPIESSDIGKKANLLTTYAIDDMPEVVTGEYRKSHQMCDGYQIRTCQIISYITDGC